MAKERGQNLKKNDTVKLKMLSFNGGEYKDPFEVNEVQIFKLFAVEATDDNQYGAVLVETIDGGDVVKDDVGKYHINVALNDSDYTIGKYKDVWNIVFEEGMPAALHDDFFEIFANAWFTDSRPIVHDFSFNFIPNRVVKGSKKYIRINVEPDLVQGSDKKRYYENLIAAGELYINVQLACGDCVPEESDLSLIVARGVISERDKCSGYYFLDTTELDCGIYMVWFELELGPNLFVSDKQPLQIYG